MQNNNNNAWGKAKQTSPYATVSEVQLPEYLLNQLIMSVFTASVSITVLTTRDRTYKQNQT